MSGDQIDQSVVWMERMSSGFFCACKFNFSNRMLDRNTLDQRSKAR